MTVAEPRPEPRRDGVDAADVDPVLWDMNSELLSLRRQLSELRQTLSGREQQLAEARQGSEVSERAVATLKGVLTDMVLKGRAEHQAAREEAARSMSERIATAQSEADDLVADAAAALTTALGRPVPWDHRAPDEVPVDLGKSPDPGPVPPPAQPWATAAAPPPPPPPPRPTPPPSFESPPPGEGTVGRGSSDPSARAAMNGWEHHPSAVQTLDPELNRQFEQVIGLLPNTEFKTPPRGTPAVSIPTVYDVTSTVVSPPPAPAVDPRPAAGPRPAPSTPSADPVAPLPATGSADADFNAFWPFQGAARPPTAEPAAVAQGRLHFGLIDALLPIIAVMLVVIVVLSWLG